MLPAVSAALILSQLGASRMRRRADRGRRDGRYTLQTFAAVTELWLDRADFDYINDAITDAGKLERGTKWQVRDCSTGNIVAQGTR